MSLAGNKGRGVLFDIFLIFGAAFLAGIVNTIAGGGTFLTFPALVFVGLPPIVANATSSVAVLPGYLSGALGYAPEVRAFDRRVFLRLCGVTVAGGVVGAIALLVSSNELFAAVVPFLLLIATVVFYWGGPIRAFVAKYSANVTPFGSVSLFVVAVYGGYFNGGLGIILLALFAMWGMSNVHEMNGLKTSLSFVVSAISVVIFAAAGIVAWSQALIMMVGALLGGYLGAPIARALPQSWVRVGIALTGLTMSLIFMWRAFMA